MRGMSHFLLGLFFLLASTLGPAQAQDPMAAETARRQKILEPLLAAFERCQNLARQGDLEDASRELSKAWKDLPEGMRSTPPARKVAGELAAWEAKLAEMAAQKNQWPDARQKALQALALDSKNGSALQTLEKADNILRRGAVGQEAVNPALTPAFFEKLSSVQASLKEAAQLRETGQLDKAETRYEAVLRTDPFNRVATEGIRKIYEERALVAEKSRDLANLEKKRQVRESWNNILPRKEQVSGSVAIAGAMTASPTFVLREKLKKTKIPQVDFTGADLETIRRALNALSRQYDPDPEKTGVNFVVSSDVASALPVNLRLRDVSLQDLVRYVAQIAGVRDRLTDVGVTFAPLVETRPDLIPRSFTVSPSFFRPSAAGDSESPAVRGGAGAKDDEVGTSANRSEQAKLEALGIVFPPGAYAVYNRNTSQLKVVNNAEMLDLIGQLISAAEEETLLINVGIRLVEINQSDLDSITANSTLAGSPLSAIPAGLTANNQGPTAVAAAGWNAQLNQIQGVGLLPNNTLQSFLQNGVLAGTNQTSSYSLNTLDLGGTILNGMQFRTMITAISQKSSANVLANPSIVLKRGQEGVIEVTQEFRYVQEYNDPQSSIRTFAPVSTTGVGFATVSFNVPGPETVISSFPSQISDPVPIGVKMGVKPDVTGDNSRVLMKLTPSFVDFEGFINYGTQINSAYAASYYDDQVTILTNNIQQPVFVRRDFELPDVEVADGHTLLLGGLLREDIQKIDEKVPILGDIPLLGRAFQGKTEQAFKKNTLVFVTPRILQVDGQPLNPTAGTATTASAALAP